MSASRGPAEPHAVAAGARAGLGIAAGAVMLAAADTYVVVLALTSIIGDVGIPVDQLQRAAPIVSGFLLGYVAMLPLLGRLSDLYGRRPVFIGCLLLFAAGSLVTGSASSLGVVVAGRTLQGLGGGGLVPVTLALVADTWPPSRRGVPLGLVGAAQELGSVLGPLYGAVMVTVSTWRTIFWVNVPLAAGLAAGFAFTRRRTGSPAPPRSQRFDGVGAALASLAALAGGAAIVAPPALVDSYTLGALYQPVAGLTPVALVALAALALLVAWELVLPARIRPLLPLRRLPEVLRRADWPGALLLAAVLGLIVIAFAVADPAAQVIAPGAAVLLPLAGVLAVVFALQERRASDPLIPFGALSDRAAIGALLTNLAIGAALIAALVDVPIFARQTAFPDSQVGAAFVLLRFLVTIPLGALAGGALCARAGNRAVTVGGMLLSAAMFVLMSRWTAATLSQPILGIGWLRSSDIVLAGGGLGFGLAIAPVNAAILGAVRASLHGLAAALVVVARSIGMLVGLSVLTVVGLHSFYAAASGIRSPLLLCPSHPGSCPEYDRALTGAVVTELDTIFLGAALCAAGAAVVALVTLRRRQGSAHG